jgi:hypothetical protein
MPLELSVDQLRCFLPALVQTHVFQIMARAKGGDLNVASVTAGRPSRNGREIVPAQWTDDGIAPQIGAAVVFL